MEYNITNEIITSMKLPCVISSKSICAKFKMSEEDICKTINEQGFLQCERGYGNVMYIYSCHNTNGNVLAIMKHLRKNKLPYTAKISEMCKSICMTRETLLFLLSEMHNITTQTNETKRYITIDIPRYTRKKTKAERTKYGDCVWLTQNEYNSLLEKTGSENNAKLAINILSAWKRKNNRTEKSTGDFFMMLSWVMDVVKNKADRKAAKKEKASRETTTQTSSENKGGREKEEDGKGQPNPFDKIIFTEVVKTSTSSEWIEAINFEEIDASFMYISFKSQAAFATMKSLYGELLFNNLSKEFGRRIIIKINK